jgi:hypothetical protein
MASGSDVIELPVDVRGRAVCPLGLGLLVSPPRVGRGPAIFESVTIFLPISAVPVLFGELNLSRKRRKRAQHQARSEAGRTRNANAS